MVETKNFKGILSLPGRKSVWLGMQLKKQSDLDGGYVMPPSTEIYDPVIYPALPEARKATA